MIEPARKQQTPRWIPNEKRPVHEQGLDVLYRARVNCGAACGQQLGIGRSRVAASQAGAPKTSAPSLTLWRAPNLAGIWTSGPMIDAFEPASYFGALAPPAWSSSSRFWTRAVGTSLLSCWSVAIAPACCPAATSASAVNNP